jgi:hypothetical protein
VEEIAAAVWEWVAMGDMVINVGAGVHARAAETPQCPGMIAVLISPLRFSM